jgi:RES domain-containing protein
LISDPKRLRAVLQSLPRITVHGPWSRAIGFDLLKGPPPGTPPGSPPQPLWPGGASLKGARFTPKKSFDSLYLAADPVTALHEVVSVFTPPTGLPLVIKTSPWVIITLDGVLSNVIDLTNTNIQKQLETSLSELTGDWAYTQTTTGSAPTQLLAQAAFDCKVLALQYTSAKNIRNSAVVVFTEYLAANSPSYLEVFDEHHNLNQRLP